MSLTGPIHVAVDDYFTDQWKRDTFAIAVCPFFCFLFGAVFCWSWTALMMLQLHKIDKAFIIRFKTQQATKVLTDWN